MLLTTADLSRLGKQLDEARVAAVRDVGDGTPGPGWCSTPIDPSERAPGTPVRPEEVHGRRSLAIDPATGQVCCKECAS